MAEIEENQPANQPEFDEQQFHRAYYLLAVYAHELIRREESMPVSIWSGQIKDESFEETVNDLVEQGYVLEVPGAEEMGYAITEAGQALVWLYSDVIRDIWKKNMDGEGEELIDFLVANLDAYADEVRQANEAEDYAEEDAEGYAEDEAEGYAEDDAEVDAEGE